MAQTEEQSGTNSNQPQPGTVVSPGGKTPQAAKPLTPSPTPKAAPIEQKPAPPAPPPPVAEDSAAKQPEPQGGLYAATDSPSNSGDQSIAWTASEFVAHDKSIGWYALLAVITLLLGAGIFFLTRDVISTAVVIVAGLLLGVYAGHRPRQLEYVLDGRGLSIAQKRYGYDEFRSFSVVQEGAFFNLLFMPLKRFAAPITVYYAPEDEDKILSILTEQLPLEEHQPDAVDSLMRRIRF